MAEITPQTKTKVKVLAGNQELLKSMQIFVIIPKAWKQNKKKLVL